MSCCKATYRRNSRQSVVLTRQALRQALPGVLENRFQSSQNLHELLQSDIHELRLFILPRLSRRAVPNWGRAYYGNATKHGEETDVEGTHVSAKIWYSSVRMNMYVNRDVRETYQSQKNASAEGFKTTRPL